MVDDYTSSSLLCILGYYCHLLTSYENEYKNCRFSHGLGKLCPLNYLKKMKDLEEHL